MNKSPYDARLKNQSKKLLKIFHEGLEQFDGEISDTCTTRYFKGSQTWRNPISFRVLMPWRNRARFIIETHIWLHRPRKIDIMCQPRFIRPVSFALAVSPTHLRREYHERLIYDWHPIHGCRQFQESAQRVLDGEIDLLDFD